MAVVTKFSVLALLALYASAAPSATTPFPNGTITSATASSPTGPVCCFVVQDSINEVWAQQYSTSTYTWLVNKTSITAHVTPYPTTKLTSYETNVYKTNATFFLKDEIGLNPLTLFNNLAPSPVQMETTYNVSQIVTHGVTLFSPEAAYIYSTLKVITAAPVTDTNGNIVCGTTVTSETGYTTTVSNYRSTKSNDSPSSTITVDPTVYINLNSNAQAYFGADIAGYFTTWGPTTTSTYTGYIWGNWSTDTITRPITVNIYTNSAGGTVDTNHHQPGITISLDTPFVYLPASSMGTTGEPGNGCRWNKGTEGLGYPPQTLLDHIISNPTLSSQYPGFQSCLPAGPSIIPYKSCDWAAPVWVVPGGDLTDITTLIYSETPTSAIETALPVSQSSAEPVMTPEINPVKTSLAPASTPTILLTPVETSAGLPPVEPPTTMASTAKDRSPSPKVPATPIQSPSSSPDNDIPASQPNESPAAGIASAIASIIGANPLPSPIVIEGTTEVLVSGQTTIPYNPVASLSGNTIMIGGFTQVVVSSVVIVPLSQALDSLPGSTALVSGTLEVVLGPNTIPVNPRLPSLSGSTTMISGAPYVVITSQITVPVVLGNPTGLGGGSNDTFPIQVSSGLRSKSIINLGVLVALMSLAAII